MQSENLITYHLWSNDYKNFVAIGDYNFLKVLSFNMIKIKILKVLLVYFEFITNNLLHLV